MTMPLNNTSAPGRTEQSHGRSRAPHPDSDYQSGVALPFGMASRNQDSKRGGFTADMRRQAELRLDATNPLETTEDMLYALGNPDTGRPDEPIVQEQKVIRPRLFKKPKYRYGVNRQK